MASCTYSVPDLEASGDNLYGPRICSQAFIDWAWAAFDFDREDWDEGFGYEEVCNNTQPLARALAGIWCLTYSSPNFPSESYSSNALEWGGRFAREEIDELDARCGDGSAFAATHAPGVGDAWTQLYLPFFYEMGVSLRAGTLVHEARHADGLGHDASNHRDSSWEYNGAWRFEVVWLAWFAFEGVNTSTAMRDQARDEANIILNTRFVNPPGFNV